MNGLWLTGRNVTVNVTFVCAAIIPCVGEIEKSGILRGCHKNLQEIRCYKFYCYMYIFKLVLII